jgi:WD40 repeat protein
VEEGGPPLHHALPHPGPVTAVAFTGDDRQFLTACEDGCVRLWSKAPGHQTTDLWHIPEGPNREQPNDERDVHSVAIHPDGRLVATAGWNEEQQRDTALPAAAQGHGLGRQIQPRRQRAGDRQRRQGSSLLGR